MQPNEVVAAIEKLAIPILAEGALDLVHCEFKREGSRWILRLFIDKEGGTGIDDCQWVSERISDLMDVEDIIPFRYYLEVSSPGLNRIIKREADFLKYRDHKIQIKCKEPYQGRKRWVGILRSFVDNKITITTGPDEVVVIPYEAVFTVNLVYEFPQKNKKPR